MSVSSERRDKHRDALVEAAERKIAASGMASLKARDLAGEIGISLGAIYNLVGDMDELIQRVMLRTLRRLEGELEVARHGAKGGAVDELIALALAYRRFASSNLHLWRSLFEHRMPAGSLVPDWLVDQQMLLFRHIDEPLAALQPGYSREARALKTRTLFSAVHGIVALGLEEKLVAVPLADLDQQLRSFVRATCAGLVQ